MIFSAAIQGSGETCGFFSKPSRSFVKMSTTSHNTISASTFAMMQPGDCAAADLFHSDPAQFFSFAIATLIENITQISQTLIENFLPDPD
jgi:hypothetical protein